MELEAEEDGYFWLPSSKEMVKLQWAEGRLPWRRRENIPTAEQLQQNQKPAPAAKCLKTTMVRAMMPLISLIGGGLLVMLQLIKLPNREGCPVEKFGTRWNVFEPYVSQRRPTTMLRSSKISVMQQNRGIVIENPNFTVDMDKPWYRKKFKVVNTCWWCCRSS